MDLQNTETKTEKNLYKKYHNKEQIFSKIIS